MQHHYQEKIAPMNREEHEALQERSQNIRRMPLIVLPFLVLMALVVWSQFDMNSVPDMLFFSFFLAVLVAMGGIVSFLAWRVRQDLQEREKRIQKGLVKGKREEISTSRSSSGSGTRTQYRYYITLGDKEISVALELFREVREGDILEISEARRSKILLAFKKYDADGQVQEEKKLSEQPIAYEQWKKAYSQQAESHSKSLGKVPLNAEEIHYLRKLRQEALLQSAFLAILIGAFLTLIGGGLLFMIASLLLVYLKAPQMAFFVVLPSILFFSVYQIYRYIHKKIQPYNQELRNLQKQVLEVLVEDKIRTNALLKIKDGSLVRRVSKRTHAHLKLGEQYYLVSQALFDKAQVGDVLLLEKLPLSDTLLRLSASTGEELYHFSQAPRV